MINCTYDPDIEQNQFLRCNLEGWFLSFTAHLNDAPRVQG
jgi:hypothetical protein